MGLILDSSVIIAGERGKFDLNGLLESHPDETVRMAAITASELLHGWERAPAGSRRDGRKKFVENVLRILPCVPFDLDCARMHAHLWARLEDRGELIGAHDLVIAAIYMCYGGRFYRDFEPERILSGCGTGTDRLRAVGENLSWTAPPVYRVD